jgi:hypothetical protein
MYLHFCFKEKSSLVLTGIFANILSTLIKNAGHEAEVTLYQQSLRLEINILQLFIYMFYHVSSFTLDICSWKPVFLLWLSFLHPSIFVFRWIIRLHVQLADYLGEKWSKAKHLLWYYLLVLRNSMICFQSCNILNMQ